MAQESLFEGIIRSLRQNAGWAVTIIGLSVIFSFMLNRHIPTVYQSESLLRVLTSESEHQTSLASSMNGILSQKHIVEKISQISGISESYIRKEDVITLSDAGPGLVRLQVRYENPVLLKELGSAIIKVLSEQFLGYNSEVQEFEIISMEKKLEHLEKNLVQLKSQLSENKSEALAETDSTTLLLETEMQQLKDHLNTLGQKLQDTPKQVFYYQEEQTAEYKTLKKQLNSEQNQLAELFKSYREKHPRVIACKNRIESLEFNLKKARTRVRKSRANDKYIALNAELQSGNEKLKLLENELVQRKETLQQESSGATPSHELLALRMNTIEELHRKTLLELEEARLRQNNSAGRINVLKKDAKPPVTVGFTSLQRDCIGLLSGVLLAVFLLYSPAPMRTEIVSLSSNVMAGVAQANIPMLTAEPAEIILEVPSLVSETLALPYLSEETEENSLFDERLIALNDPASIRLKPFKSLVSRLQISISESQTRIVLVGSARKGAGKTTLLANTAILMAKAGYSVLMIDANFRNPTLHKVFDLSNSRGLSDMLLNGMQDGTIQNTVVKNLSLLSTGIAPANPSECLGSQKMIELLSGLKRKVEIILIDTPAILEHPEAGTLASHTGAMVFLHREGETEEDLRAAKNQLKLVRARIFGYVKI